MKNKVVTAILAIGICGVAAFGAVSVKELKEQINEVKKQQEQMNVLESEKAVMQEQLGTLESEKVVMQEQLGTLESEKVELQNQVTGLSEQMVAVLDTETDLLVEQCIAEIDSIGEVTFEDEALILDLEATYAQMTEEQKNKLTNYVELKNARRELEKMIREVAVEGKYEALNDDWDGYLEFIPSNMERTEGEVLEYARSNSGDELESSMRYTIKDGMMQVDGDQVEIYVHNGNIILEDYICEGEIPDGERFEAKVIFDGDTLEFYEDGTAAFTDRPRPDEFTYEREGDILKLEQEGKFEYLYVYEKKLYYDVYMKK